MASRPGDDELPPDPFPGDPFARSDAPLSENAPDSSNAPDQSTAPMSGLFAQFAQATAAQGTFNADVARHLAIWTAAGGAVEPNLEPLVRIQVEQVGTAVGPLVEELTGLLLHQPGEKLIVTAATKAEWAADSLTAWRPFFNGLAAGVGAMFDGSGLLGSGGDHDGDDDEMPDELRALGLGALPGGLSGLAKMMGPTLAGMQAGTLLGQLGTSALGTYDLLVPRVTGSRLLVVTSNVTAFTEAWTLPTEHALTQIVTRDLLTHAILRQPHVGGELSALINRHASAGRVDPSGIGEIGIAGLGGGLGGLLGGAAAMGGGMGAPSPDAFLAGEPTPEQQDLRRQIRRITIPLVATIDYLASAIGARLLGDNRQVAEALRRRHLDRDPGTRLAEHLLGVGVDQAGLDAGRVFVGGVLQRAGHDGLIALFAEPDRFPTDAELVAPGLWLARIGLAE